jgi:hypothetical protein
MSNCMKLTFVSIWAVIQTAIILPVMINLIHAFSWTACDSVAIGFGNDWTKNLNKFKLITFGLIKVYQMHRPVGHILYSKLEAQRIRF